MTVCLSVVGLLFIWLSGLNKRMASKQSQLNRKGAFTCAALFSSSFFLFLSSSKLGLELSESPN